MKVQQRIARIRSSEISADDQLLELFGVSRRSARSRSSPTPCSGRSSIRASPRFTAIAGGAAVIAEIVIEKSRAALGRTVAENEKAAA